MEQKQFKHNLQDCTRARGCRNVNPYDADGTGERFRCESVRDCKMILA